MFSIRRSFRLGNVGYFTLGKQILAKIHDDGCAEYAAAMAYYMLLALFPFLLFLTTVIAYIPVPDLMEFILGRVKTVVPDQVFILIRGYIRTLFGTKQGGLLSIGILLAIWTSSNVIIATMNVMNRLYGVSEKRSYWKARLTAIALMMVLSLLFLFALLLLLFGPKIGALIADLALLGNLFRVTWEILLIPVIPLLLVLALALIYHFTPNLKQQWRWISPGSFVAIPVWIGGCLVFSYYINNFGSYDKTYGSIGAVIVLLLWLYLSGFIILAGAEINAVIEHNSAGERHRRET
jgi:membrane protein